MAFFIQCFDVVFFCGGIVVFAEEELKRLQTSSYAQVSFNYDNPPAAALPEKQPSVEEEEVDEEAFEPSANFPIPSDIELVS